MYEFVGFTGFEQRSVFPIVKQQLIDNFPATADLIEAHLQNLGFKKQSIITGLMKHLKFGT